MDLRSTVVTLNYLVSVVIMRMNLIHDSSILESANIKRNYMYNRSEFLEGLLSGS